MGVDVERLNLLYSLRRYADGEKAAREAIAEEPEWGAGYTFLALFLVNQQRARDAVAPARTGVGKAPHDPWAHAILSLALARSNSRGAMAAAREAVKFNPYYAFGHAMMAELLCDRGAYTDAHAAAQEGMRHNPDDELLHHWKGWAEYKLGRNAEALETADAGLRLHPQSPQLLNVRGSVLQKLAERTRPHAIVRWVRHHRLADEVYREAVRLDPAEKSYQENREINAVAFRRRLLNTLWLGAVLASAVACIITGARLGSLGAGVAIALMLFTVWLGGCVVVMGMPQWVVLSIPLGWLGAAPVPLSLADRRERREVGLVAVITVGVLVISVCISAIVALFRLDSH